MFTLDQDEDENSIVLRSLVWYAGSAAIPAFTVVCLNNLVFVCITDFRSDYGYYSIRNLAVPATVLYDYKPTNDVELEKALKAIESL